MPETGRSWVELLAEAIANTEETYKPADPEWLELAECSLAGIAARDFFENEANHRLAKETCERCGIALPCLKYALDNNEKEGVWGGTDMKERRAIRAKLIRRRSSAA